MKTLIAVLLTFAAGAALAQDHLLRGEYDRLWRQYYYADGRLVPTNAVAEIAGTLGDRSADGCVLTVTYSTLAGIEHDQGTTDPVSGGYRRLPSTKNVYAVKEDSFFVRGLQTDAKRGERISVRVIRAKPLPSGLACYAVPRHPTFEEWQAARAANEVLP